jgi:hypothetical protein
MWYGTLGFFERGDTKRDGEQHKLIEPDMFKPIRRSDFSGVRHPASSFRKQRDIGPIPCFVIAVRISQNGVSKVAPHYGTV